MNGRLDSLQAAVLLEKLTIFDEELSLRAKISNQYRNTLKNCQYIEFSKHARGWQVRSLRRKYAYLEKALKAGTLIFPALDLEYAINSSLPLLEFLSLLLGVGAKDAEKCLGDLILIFIDFQRFLGFCEVKLAK